ncbi:hypothetical protein AFLA_000844 [Aspergillus flavus NRRL3357]|nr:hypothetical protein AFLA_000844 [Aspergillus flavus NRRL3357]
MAVMNAVESCISSSINCSDGIHSTRMVLAWRTHIRARPSLSLEQPVRQAQSVGGHGIECRAKEEQTPEAARAKI